MKILKKILIVVPLLAAIVTIVKYIEDHARLVEDKSIIYTYFSDILEKRDNTISRLMDENFLIKDQLNRCNRVLQESPYKVDNVFSDKVLYGKVISIDNAGLADVRIEVEGGNQVYSNSNGEFLINYQLGQHIKFEKSGYKTYEFNVSRENSDRYQKIILEEVNHEN